MSPRLKYLWDQQHQIYRKGRRVSNVLQRGGGKTAALVYIECEVVYLRTLATKSPQNPDDSDIL